MGVFVNCTVVPASMTVDIMLLVPDDPSDDILNCVCDTSVNQ